MAEALPPLLALPALQCYKMEGTPLGFGVIIINSFDEFPDIKRTGVDMELESFKKLFISIGLELKVYYNLTKKEISSELRLIARDEKLEKHSMFAIAISSHGGEDGLFGNDVRERLDRMKKKEPLKGLDDTITLIELKDIFNSMNCSMLTCKPKLFLLNGWKEGKKDSESKADGAGTGDQFASVNSDFLTICSSFDISSSLEAGSNLPASIFPTILCDTFIMYKDEPLNTLMGVVKGELKKKSNKKIKLKGKGRSIDESCAPETTLQYQLQLSFGNNENPGSGGDEGTKGTS